MLNEGVGKHLFGDVPLHCEGRIAGSFPCHITCSFMPRTYSLKTKPLQKGQLKRN